jgi:hypothetical protein
MLYHFLAVYSIFGSLFIQNPGDTWMLEYNIERTNGAISTEYIIIQDEAVTQVNEFPSSVTTYQYSQVDRTVTMMIIWHGWQTYFLQTVPWDSLSQDFVHPTSDPTTVEVVDGNGGLQLTAILSDTLPNVHPRTIRYCQIGHLPIKLTLEDRVLTLTKVVHEKGEIDKVLRKINVEGFDSMDLEYHKVIAPYNTGQSFEQLRQGLEQIIERDKE